MAIRFVDVEPEDAGKPKRAQAPKPDPAVGREAPPASVEPELPHPKPEPKPRGRKKPLR